MPWPYSLQVRKRSSPFKSAFFARARCPADGGPCDFNRTCIFVIDQVTMECDKQRRTQSMQTPFRSLTGLQTSLPVSDRHAKQVPARGVGRIYGRAISGRYGERAHSDVRLLQHSHFKHEIAILTDLRVKVLSWLPRAHQLIRRVAGNGDGVDHVSGRERCNRKWQRRGRGSRD